MKSLEDRFDELREELEQDYDSFNKVQGVNIALFVYSPRREKKVISEVQRLSHKLSDSFLQSETLSLSKIVFEAFEELLGIDEVIEREKEAPNRLLEEANQPLLDYITSKILDLDESMDQGVTLIHRCGGIYPFLSVHALTARLETELNNPTIFFYPGKRKRNYMRFLNGSEEHVGNYRAKIYEVDTS
ncbi:hypothetical protein AKJ40_01350 [candidate division MSBL1 archaeon SCGC-AAA259M10]|uniref:DUF1788 domain-containing protein n=1 Tax=candidate division MSBL1 archaeon SCGC-AAA259M10 TaxID=1698270 RepID=A0A133V1W4_9EURY|nr:hypothetical protein AKJ40_01350 [candidate division MSBL1 archaeon SCGC-AAA259M10]